jgi:hypothetical protein
MKPVSQFVILITLHLSVSLDHQMCINENNENIKFMLNYTMKMDPFLNVMN